MFTAESSDWLSGQRSPTDHRWPVSYTKHKKIHNTSATDHAWLNPDMDVTHKSYTAPAQKTALYVSRPARVPSSMLQMNFVKAKKASLTESQLTMNFENTTFHKDFVVNKKIDKPVTILSHGDITKVEQLVHPELKRLSQDIPFVLLDSHAEATNKSYHRIFSTWKVWASKFPEVSVFPVKPLHLALFALHWGKVTASAANLKMLVPAIEWAHRMAGLEKQLDSQFLRDILNGLIRTYAKVKNPKEPLAIEHVKKVMDITDKSLLKDFRVAAIIVLAFSAFLRFDEIANIKCSNLDFKSNHLQITIEKSKTDQLRLGNSVVIAHTNTEHCPVTF